MFLKNHPHTAREGHNLLDLLEYAIAVNNLKLENEILRFQNAVLKAQTAAAPCLHTEN